VVPGGIRRTGLEWKPVSREAWSAESFHLPERFPMTVSGSPDPPGPDEPRRLSTREQAILARIESDLVEDPALNRLASTVPSVPRLTSPVAARDLGLLVVILLVLVAAASLLPSALVWIVLPGLTVLLVVPWTVHCVRRAAADR